MEAVRSRPSGLISRRWTIPFVPPSLNDWQGRHWAHQRTVKQAWYEQAWGLMNQAATALPPMREWCHVSAVLVFRRNAHRDLSNYDAVLWKLVGDMLQSADVIPDDTEREFRRGRVTFRIDKTLLGQARHPEQKGLTVLALVVPE